MFYEFARLTRVDMISGLAAGIFLVDSDPSSLKRSKFSKLSKCKNGPAAGVLFGEDSETVFSEVDWYLRRSFDGKLAHGAWRHDLGAGGRVLSQRPRIGKRFGRIPKT